MPIRTLVWTLLLAAFGVTYAQGYEWRDVVQTVEIRSDGSVIVEDTRTLVVTQGDVSGASICLDLAPDQRLDLLGGGALREGPAARVDTQPCANGTALVITMAGGERITERRVFFWYALRDTLDYYRDVTQWQRALLEANHPPVRGYSLTVTAPGSMQAPYTVYIDRSGTPQDAGGLLSDDRSQLQVTFDQVPAGDNVNVRYLMDPELFEQRGSGAGLEPLLRDATGTTGTASEFRNALQTWIDDALTWLRSVVPTNLSFVAQLFITLVVGLSLYTLITAVALRRVRKRVGGNFRVTPQQPVFEPPSDLPPAVVAVLLSRPNILLGFYIDGDDFSPHRNQDIKNGLSATIMDLARRGYCGFIRSRERWQGRRTSDIVLYHDRGGNDLLLLEQQVLDYLIAAEQYGRQYLNAGRTRGRDRVTLFELRAYSRKKWRESTKPWTLEVCNYTLQYFGRLPFTDESLQASKRWEKILRIGTVAGFGLTIASFVLTFALGSSTIFGVTFIFAILSAILFVILTGLANFASADLLAWHPAVISEVRGWLGFRQTLNDYSLMRNAPDDFFVLWDRYFCYAAAFGVAKSFLRNIRRIFPERNLSEGDMTARVSWMDSDSLDDMDDFSSLSEVADSLSDTLDSLSDSTGDSSSDGGDGGGDGD